MALLENMRSGSQSWLIYGAFGILIIVFVFYFGPGTEGCQPGARGLAATVGPDEIYNTDLNAVLKRVQTGRKNRLDDGAFAELQRQSTERLALLHYLAQKAEEEGFVVNDTELKAFILNKDENPEYTIYASKEGAFDPELYQRFIQYGLEMSVEDYQEFKRRELLTRKYLTVLEESLAPTTAEVQATVELRNTKVNLEYVEFDPIKLKASATFSDAEIATFLGSKEAEVKAYFDANKKDYETSKEAQIRRIMIKKPPVTTATDADKKKAADTWAAVQKRIEAKEDFAVVAKEVSEDIVYKDKGGDMGWAMLDDMNQDTAKVVDSMAKGEVKEQVSNFAYFLLKLEDVKPATKRTYEDAKKEIATKLLAEAAGDKQVNEASTKLFAAAKAAPTQSLSDTIAGLQAKAATPVPVPVPTPTPGVDDDPTPVKVVVAPQKKSVWDALKSTETGLFSREPRKSYKFDPEKGIVPTAAPWTDVPRIGDSKDLAVEAFALTSEKPMGSKVYNVGGKKYIVRLTAREEPKKEDAEQQRTAVENELNREMVNAYLGPWQTIIYRPDADLNEVSPWLAQVYKAAVDSGRIVITTGMFTTTVGADAGPDAAADPTKAASPITITPSAKPATPIKVTPGAKPATPIKVTPSAKPATPAPAK